METPGTQVPRPYAGQTQPPPVHDCHSDAHYLMALGVVLLCFGQAITGRHEVTMIGLAMIVFSGLFE